MSTVTWIIVVTALPFLVVLLTSFIKAAVVLALLRNALGAPEVPPTVVVTALALLLTAFVMAPVAEAAWERAALPEVPAAEITPADAVAAAGRAAEPVRAFLSRHAHARDRAVFLDLARRLRGPAVAEDDLLVLAAAFVTSELKEAFTIGFLVFLPFLVLDLLVAVVLAALGLVQVPPVAVALPLKLLLFVLVDGWLVLARGLVLGYV